MAMDESADWPATCILPTAERLLRGAEFDELFASGRWYRRRLTTQLDLAIAPEATPRARGLAERESCWCSFFSFELDAVDGDVVMHIGVPASQGWQPPRSEHIDAALLRAAWSAARA